MLNKARILPCLVPELRHIDLQWYILSSTPSTNTACRTLPDNGSRWVICCAEEQTAGKGRLGRQWNSPFAQNIYCSLRWRTQMKLPELTGLSQVISLALHRALSLFIDSATLSIKWPNDLMYAGKKIAGILIETVTSTSNETQVIIGFGVNVNSNTQISPLSEQPHCSMFDIQAHCFDRNLILAQCINQLYLTLQQFIENGLGFLLEEWHQHDSLYNQLIQVQQQHRQVKGIAKGINACGQLQLETDSGLQVFNAGDASICKPVK